MLLADDPRDFFDLNGPLEDNIRLRRFSLYERPWTLPVRCGRLYHLPHFVGGRAHNANPNQYAEQHEVHGSEDAYNPQGYSSRRRAYPSADSLTIIH